MKTKKIFESALLGAALSVSSAFAKPEMSKASQVPEATRPTMENIDFTVIDSNNKLQQVETLPTKTQAKLYNQMVNSRRTLYIDLEKRGVGISSGNMCIGKDGKELLVAIEHGVVHDGNRELFEKMIDDGSVARVTMSSRYASQNNDDFQFVIPKDKAKLLGIKIVKGFEDKNATAVSREANIEVIGLDGKDIIASNLKKFRADSSLPKCNFGIFKGEVPDLNHLGVAQNQWGRAMEVTHKNIIGMVPGDSGSPLMGITKKGEITTFGFYKGIGQSVTNDYMEFRSDINLIKGPQDALDDMNTTTIYTYMPIDKKLKNNKVNTIVEQYESVEPKISIP